MRSLEELAKWSIDADHYSAFVRTFTARPKEPMPYLYETVEIRRGATVAATYDARIAGVHIRHQWDEKDQVWWSSASFSFELINPRTQARYRSGWKSQIQYHRGGRPGSDLTRIDWIAPLVDATRPNTVITVLEVAR